MLHEDGNNVTLFGFEKHEKGMKQSESIEDAIKSSKVIIGPLPFTNKSNQLNTPYHTSEINIEDILKLMNKNHIFLGGHIAEEWLELANEYKLTMIDYFAREELQVLNAIPTAEGAIQLAMEEMDTTIHGSNIIILGFGRIGKVLANVLARLGANVTVVARKYEDIAWITSYGYKALFFEHIRSELHKMDVILNTVPAIILNQSKLERLNKNSIIIDLASNPGGVDFKHAEKIGVKAIRALGLPGKVAPLSAANCIRETIYNILYDLEVNK